jgi:NAD(P)-dependent dehydrogenase (short-subunit alcohol dehydrogenase family)
VTVLVTGAGRGIGRALHDLYAERGTPVIGTARAPEPPMMRLDVADPASHAALASALGGRALEVVVCNAGVYPDRGLALADYSAALMAEAFAVNATGPLLTVQALLPLLRRGERPRVAIVSSQLGSSEIASGGGYAYRASKAAAINLARNLAVDLKGEGIAVGAYHPGWVATDMGGESAPVTPRASAEGLAARIEALSLETTGAFETWDGRPHPF